MISTTNLNAVHRTFKPLVESSNLSALTNCLAVNVQAQTELDGWPDPPLEEDFFIQ
jgi:hypothetical protein